MYNLKEQPINPSVVGGMAASRALAKARVGDTQALRWLIEQREAGNHFAARAVAELVRAQSPQSLADRR